MKVLNDMSYGSPYQVMEVFLLTAVDSKPDLQFLTENKPCEGKWKAQ